MKLRRSDENEDAAVAAGEAAAAAATVQATPIQADPTAAAFFDVDNTMMVGASIFHFARGLASRKFFTTRDLVGFATQQAKFRFGGKESLTGMADARESALGFVAGRSVAEITALGEEIYDELMVERIYEGTRALAQAHLDAGQRVWLVTATPVELALVIARRLGLTGALGTVAESVDGVYTGKLVGEPLHGRGKAEAIRALAEREQLDLSRCSAYSDSVNDVPMLSAVGFPTAVNPDADLLKYAEIHDWAVRDFRRGRKAAKVGLPVAGGAMVFGGTLAAGAAIGIRLAERNPSEKLVARVLASAAPILPEALQPARPRLRLPSSLPWF